MKKPTKYYIFHMVLHSSEYYQQTPEEEARSQEETNTFFRSWYPKVEQIIGSHAMSMVAEWDWMGVFAVDELSDWEAFREEYRRSFPGRVTKSLSLPGVSHEEFTRATGEIEHYKKMRELGSYPGGAEGFTEKT